MGHIDYRGFGLLFAAADRPSSAWATRAGGDGTGVSVALANRLPSVRGSLIAKSCAAHCPPTATDL